MVHCGLLIGGQVEQIDIGWLLSAVWILDDDKTISLLPLANKSVIACSAGHLRPACTASGQCNLQIAIDFRRQWGKLDTLQRFNHP
jgi:hypothetical protein